LMSALRGEVLDKVPDSFDKNSKFVKVKWR
jgi:hypothetical protein